MSMDNLSLSVAILDVNLSLPTADFDEPAMCIVREAWRHAKAELERSRELLRPLADVPIPAHAKDHWPVWSSPGLPKYRDVRAARAFLDPAK